MSVINKMLRDLDSRQGVGASGAQAQAGQNAFARDTLAVPASAPVGHRTHGFAGPWRALLGLALLVCATAVWWILPQKVSPAVSIVAGETIPVEPPGPAGVSAGAASNSVPTAKPAANTMRSASQTVVTTLRASEPKLALRPVDLPLKMDFSLKAVPTGHVPSRSVAASVPRTALDGIKPVAPSPAASSAAVAAPMPTLQALAQAQNLWNAGSHEVALDLLRDALAHVERIGTGANNAVLAQLARELARMELAQGRPGRALELLQRLEPALSGVAEVWALRGNVAQRLGRHQESAYAYLAALGLRPQEPRWMLGAAVSLAANGQAVEAAEWAEKARATGVLSAEVAAYLRQSGVTLRER